MHLDPQTGPIALGIITLVSNLVSWRTGKHNGRLEGESKYINSVKEAAAIVIIELKEQHKECHEKLAKVTAQVAELMAQSAIASYPHEGAD